MPWEERTTTSGRATFMPVRAEYDYTRLVPLIDPQLSFDSPASGDPLPAIRGPLAIL